MSKTLNIGKKAQALAWFASVEERKKRVHPEHPKFIEGCQRCIDFRRSLFEAN